MPNEGQPNKNCTDFGTTGPKGGHFAQNYGFAELFHIANNHKNHIIVYYVIASSSRIPAQNEGKNDS
jgi:hypothetical protein